MNGYIIAALLLLASWIGISVICFLLLNRKKDNIILDDE